MENLRFINKVTAHYRLDAPQEACFVAGGLQHRLMKLQIARETWALKILNPRLVETPLQRAKLERAESVAKRARDANLPVLVSRLGPDGAHLQCVDETWVMLSAWIEGETLPPTAVDPARASEMGRILGRLHALKIRFPDQSAPEPEAFAPGHFEALAARGHSERAIWADAIADALPLLIDANTRAMQTQLALQNGWVTGHLDFDQKNVLWRENRPTILDWESAKAIHPALECVGAGLSWAGQSAGETSPQTFAAWLAGYREENAVSRADLETACDAVLGKWLIWLEWNLARSLDLLDAAQRQICHDALFHALGATLKLRDDIPLYRSWCAA